jgi:hypothetical protein
MPNSIASYRSFPPVAPTNGFFPAGSSTGIDEIGVSSLVPFLLTNGAEHYVPVCIQKVHLGMASVIVARFRQNQGVLNSLEAGSFACLPHHRVKRQAELPVSRGGPAPLPGPSSALCPEALR